MTRRGSVVNGIALIPIEHDARSKRIGNQFFAEATAISLVVRVGVAE
jgi:hypothetical protein